MKKVLTLVCVLACAVFANAQDREFKPFKVDLALGYAIPPGDYGGGLVFAIEPKYAIQDQLAVGLRWDLALLANVDIAGESADVKAVSSYAPTLDYYFGTKKSRFFVGAGAGLFQYAAATVNSNTPNEDVPYYSYNKFGVFPRLGGEFAHFRVAAEYNIVPKELSVSNSYFSIKVGVFIGGGKYD
jgi:hypothetical protein